ncbi:MAG: hypothetical protein M0R39_17415 [Prolixibacteraceae bacterium]|nr:hypothetical protein [Prolixibacteraceae bacterium]
MRINHFLSKLHFNKHLLLIIPTAIFATIGAYFMLFSHAAPDITADFNSDNTVNIYDLSILATNWGKTSATHTQGDANSDTIVNIYDLSALASQWGQTATPTPTPTPTGQPANSINVKDYGATGNGSTDDTASLLAAFNAAVAQGKTAWVPAGTYLINSRLSLPSNINITGSGNSSWLSGPISVGNGNTISQVKIGKYGYSTYLGGVSDILINNVRFTGGGGAFSGNWPYYNAHVITIGVGGDASNITFDNCDIERNSGTENATKSLHLDNIFISSGVKAGEPLVSNVLFKNSRFGVSNGVNNISPRFNVEIYDSYTDSNRVQGTREVNFEDNTFEPSESASIDYSGATLSSDSSIPVSGYSHVTGNVFKGNGYGSNPKWPDDITVEKGSGYVVVDNNTFYRGRDMALAANAPGHNQFTNNIVDSRSITYDTGIAHNWIPYVALEGDYNTITGNTVISTGPQAEVISVDGNYNTIINNIVRGGSIIVNGSNNISSPNSVDMSPSQ